MTTTATTTTAPTTTPETASGEPFIALPTRRLLLAVCAAAAATALMWAVVATAIGPIGQNPGPQIVEGAAGAAVVAVVGILGVLLIRPWKKRAMSSWTTMWLAATVMRLLLTPALAYLLYSAAPLSLTPLMLSVAVTYVIVQSSEAAALALHLKRVT